MSIASLLGASSDETPRVHPSAPSALEGFYKLSRSERFARLMALGLLTQSDVDHLNHSQMPPFELTEKLIENGLGYFPIPLGVATQVPVDGKEYVVPMAVEETSIIAALGKSAKWVRQSGCLETEIRGNTLIGQIQCARVQNLTHFVTRFDAKKAEWAAWANAHPAAGLVKRGGGVRDLTLRILPREQGACMAVIHVSVDCCDAMGANILNQIVEALKPHVELETRETVSMCILSNLNDQKVTVARVSLESVDPALGHRLEEASLFAESDPYRAATSNKGVLNGIDPIAIATGNDWRAIEAGVHAYAARSGTYQPVTRWRFDGRVLTGTLEAPIVVGTVGGVTHIHPTARVALSLLGVRSANELSRVMGAVGLLQNLGAIRALTTEGIIQGHMRLHIDNLTLSAGASAAEMPLLKSKLEQWLGYHKRVSLSNAVELLHAIRVERRVSSV